MQDIVYNRLPINRSTICQKLRLPTPRQQSHGFVLDYSFSRPSCFSLDPSTFLLHLQIHHDALQVFFQRKRERKSSSYHRRIIRNWRGKSTILFCFWWLCFRCSYYFFHSYGLDYFGINIWDEK